MRYTFVKQVILGIIFFLSTITFVAQNKQYTLNQDKTEVAVLVDNNDTKLTVANVLTGKYGSPFVGAKLYNLSISMDTVGVWSELPSGEKVWTLSVSVPQAKSFYISFDDFYLPQGSTLYVYNKNDLREAIQYLPTDNPRGGAYSIENLRGDNAILEYVAPKNSKEHPRLSILDVGYKYIDSNTGPESSLGPSGACMINVNCDQGADWQSQKKGVVLLKIKNTKGGSNFCSGALINNTAKDKTPYVLTAWHCFENVITTNPENIEVFFDYESLTCETTTERPTYKYHKGGDVLVLNPEKVGSDGALIKLTETIPDDWDVYFNGWNRENTGATSGAVIHHPLGDVKKITLYNKALTSTTWTNSPSGAHWLVAYSEGATQGGSSGGPIFNQSGLIVGTLTGGANSCSNPNGYDYYGKLWYHWDQYGTNAQTDHMDRYLDPVGNGGATMLVGMHNNPNAIRDIILSNTQLSVLRGDVSEISILDGNGGYEVSSSDSKIASVSLDNNRVTITAGNTGSAVVTVTDSKNATADINVSVHSNIEYTMSGKNLKVTVYDTNDAIKRVRIVNITGDTVYDKKGLDVKEHTIDVTTYSRDAYILQTFTKNGAKKAEKITW